MRRSTNWQYGRRSKGKNRREDDVSKAHISFIYALLKTSPCATGRNAIGGVCRREFAVLSVAADLRGGDYTTSRCFITNTIWSGWKRGFQVSGTIIYRHFNVPGSLRGHNGDKRFGLWGLSEGLSEKEADSLSQATHFGYQRAGRFDETCWERMSETSEMTRLLYRITVAIMTSNAEITMKGDHLCEHSQWLTDRL